MKKSVEPKTKLRNGAQEQVIIKRCGMMCFVVCIPINMHTCVCIIRSRVFFRFIITETSTIESVVFNDNAIN